MATFKSSVTTSSQRRHRSCEPPEKSRSLHQLHHRDLRYTKRHRHMRQRDKRRPWQPDDPPLHFSQQHISHNLHYTHNSALIQMHTLIIQIFSLTHDIPHHYINTTPQIIYFTHKTHIVPQIHQNHTQSSESIQHFPLHTHKTKAKHCSSLHRHIQHKNYSTNRHSHLMPKHTTHQKNSSDYYHRNLIPLLLFIGRLPHLPSTPTLITPLLYKNPLKHAYYCTSHLHIRYTALSPFSLFSFTYCTLRLAYTWPCSFRQTNTVARSPADSLHTASISEPTLLHNMAPSRKSKEDSWHSTRSLKSSGSGSKKKKLTVQLGSLDLHTSSLNPAADEPVAVRDYPEDCTPQEMLSPNRVAIDPTRTNAKRRLLLKDDSDTELSQQSSDASAQRQEVHSLRGSRAPSPLHHKQVPHDDLDELIILESQPAPEQPPLDDSATFNIIQNKGAPDQYFPFLWYSFSVHEILNSHAGLTPALNYTAEYLAIQGTPDAEIQEYFQCRHAFPHVPQQLFPTIRPDGQPGQYYHLTQIPQNTEIDIVTGLSPTYQVTIRFDRNYHTMTKLEVQQAAHSRLELMSIPLANRMREPIAALVSPQNAGWLGFLKLDLLNPATDGLALLRGHRLFTLQLQNGEYVIGKVEKGFEFSSTANNRRGVDFTYTVPCSAN